MKTSQLKDVLAVNESQQIISNIKKELQTAEGDYKNYLLESLERETPGYLIVKCLKEENEKEMTFRINRDGKEFYHVFFLNNNDNLTCVVFDERAQIQENANPQLRLAEALCKKCIIDGDNDNVTAYYGCQFRVPESYKVSCFSVTNKTESREKPTITEFQAEELTHETGKTFTELSEQYNIVDVTDHMNHGEEFY